MNNLLTLIFWALCGLSSTTSAAYLKGFVNEEAESDVPFDINESMFDVKAVSETDSQFENDVQLDADGVSGRRLVYCDMEYTMEHLPDYYFACYCGGIGSRGSGLLGSFCTDTYKYCAMDNSNCATATVWAYMNSGSKVTSLFNTFTYSGSRTDRINISKLDCTGGAANSLDNVVCGRCTVKVNYNTCKSCSLKTEIPSTRYPWGGAVNVDCSNLGYGNFDLSTDPSIPAANVFAVLSKKGPDYQTGVPA